MPSGEILSLDARSCKPLQQIFRGYVAGIRAGQSASVYALTLVTARRETRRFSPPDIHVSLIAQLVCSRRAWSERKRRRASEQERERERERERGERGRGRRRRIRTFYNRGDVLSDVRRELSQKIEHRVLSRVPDAQVDPSVQECPHHLHLPAERRLVHRGPRGRPGVHVDARRQQHLHHGSETDIFIFSFFFSSTPLPPIFLLGLNYGQMLFLLFSSFFVDGWENRETVVFWTKQVKIYITVDVCK